VATSLLYATLHLVQLHNRIAECTDRMLGVGTCKDVSKRIVLLLRLLPTSATTERGVVVNLLALTLRQLLRSAVQHGKVRARWWLSI
jgi:hypothetical protein